MRSRRLQWVKVLRGYRKKMMPVMHSQFQTRRAGLDSLAPLSNHLGAYEKNCAPTRPTAAGILLRAEVYTNSGHLLRRTCLSIETSANLGNPTTRCKLDWPPSGPRPGGLAVHRTWTILQSSGTAS